MKSLLEKSTTEEILQRLDKITAETKARWGIMNAGQMMAHCQVPIKVALGEAKLKRALIGLLFGPMEVLDTGYWILDTGYKDTGCAAPHHAGRMGIMTVPPLAGTT